MTECPFLLCHFSYHKHNRKEHMGLKLQPTAVQDASPSSQCTHSAQDQGDFWPDRGSGLGSTSLQARQNWFLRLRNAERIGESRWRTRLTTQPVRRYLLDGEKKHSDGYLWSLNQLVVPYWLILNTSQYDEEQAWKNRLIADWFPLWTFRNTSWEFSLSHQQGGESSGLLSTREQRQEQVAPHWGASDEPLRHPAGGRGDTALPLSDTRTQRPAIVARPLTWTMLLESSSMNKKDA